MFFHSFTTTCKVLMLILVCGISAVGTYLYQRQAEPEVLVVEKEAEPQTVVGTAFTHEPIVREQEVAPQKEIPQTVVSIEPVQVPVEPIALVEKKPTKMKQSQQPQAALKKTIEQPKPVITTVAEIPPVVAPAVPESQQVKQVDERGDAEEIATSAKTRRIVTCKNLITKSMTGYRKLGRTWYPDEYYLSCNGVELAEGESMDFEVSPDNTCTFSFFYDFRPMGPSYKKGTEDLKYRIPENTDQIEVSFSWYENPTIMVKAYVS